ncbi:hypothetical protein HK14_09965 [Acetobacter cibinongensis]|uniref:Uncharacterized protein n=1 Tax=Acetobacter cibinongensis TaxID=146475 RepID=A0A1Z5YSY7_9PROT|nr:hypothetical protein HK14_09965 [Acetobacter cibinongensis]
MRHEKSAAGRAFLWGRDRNMFTQAGPEPQCCVMAGYAMLCVLRTEAEGFVSFFWASAALGYTCFASRQHGTVCSSGTIFHDRLFP